MICNKYLNSRYDLLRTSAGEVKSKLQAVVLYADIVDAIKR